MIRSYQIIKSYM